jgi:hypothetical protein
VTNHCVFLPNTAPPASTFAWNHGGFQPEIATTWIGWVGPGVRNLGQTHDTWTDHTDLRPTLLALVGLHDSYVSDGRVVSEFVEPSALPLGLRGNPATISGLGQAWKQLNAPFGGFGADTLKASTTAVESTSTNDATYADITAQIETLTASRDALAGRIRLALDRAEFDGVMVKEQQARAWIAEANSMLASMHALAGGS